MKSRLEFNSDYEEGESIWIDLENGGWIELSGTNRKELKLYIVIKDEDGLYHYSHIRFTESETKALAGFIDDVAHNRYT